jgi:adenine-specific DNA-methyltransferase
VTHESAYLRAKGRPAKPLQPLDDVEPWEYTSNAAHPTEKVVSVLRPFLKSLSRPGARVHPFAGSGSTPAAAILSGTYIGIVLKAKYVAHACRRLNGVARFATSRGPRERPDGAERVES